MTTNRLFLSVTLALTVTILVFGFRLISRDKRVMPTLKMSLSLSLSLSEDGLDPANVQTLNDANLIRNLYTRLVEYNVEEELVTAAAASFEISGNHALLTLSYIV